MKRGKITQPRSTISKLPNFKKMLVYKIFDHQKWNFLLPSLVGWFSFWWHHLFGSIVGAETALDCHASLRAAIFACAVGEDEKWRPLHLHARHPLASTGDQSKTRNEIGPLKSATHSSKVRFFLLHFIFSRVWPSFLSRNFWQKRGTLDHKMHWDIYVDLLGEDGGVLCQFLFLLWPEGNW